MMEILTLLVVPIVIALFTLLIEYWIIQPLRQKKARSQLISNIQEVPLQNYLQPNNRNLRLPPNNIIVISALGIRIFDLSAIPHPYEFKFLIPAFAQRSEIKTQSKHRYFEPEYYLYSNWKRIKPDAFVLPFLSENSVFVLSQYPCYELLETADVLQDGLISTIRHKPLFDSIEARLEYEYRMILDLERLSRKVKLVSVTNDKTFYRLQLRCKSIRDIKDDGEVAFNDQCELEITIPDGYPAKHPKIRTTTKVVHPNIHAKGDINFYVWWIDVDNNELSLASMCLVIIEMLEYQQFSINSPFNIDAAYKFRYIKSIVPLDSSNLKGF